MLGLFGTLNLGARSLATQRQGVEVAGHNLANVNNPAYARQRLIVQTGPALNTPAGPQGTGANVAAIQQLRDTILDRQITSEAGVRGSLEAQQRALQYAEANLGQQVDRLASGTEGSAAAQGTGAAHSLADGLADLFNGFQSLSTHASSPAERQGVLQKASDLATQFNQIDRRLGQLAGSLNESLSADVDEANTLLADIAQLNDQIAGAEISGEGSANDLRDLREQKIEALAQQVKVDISAGAHGTLNIAIAGQAMVTGNQVSDALECFDAGAGQMLVRSAGTGTPLALTGGRLEGTIAVRDGEVATLRGDLSSLAALLISEVNTIHAAGYSLTGSTGENFFSGHTAADIAVNPTLAANPALVQAAGFSDAAGNNQVALALGQLGDQKFPALGGQTFSQRYAQTVGMLGQSLSSLNTQLDDQKVVEDMLTRQRDAVSGVSLDEEMTEMTKYQKAFEASARLITTVDEMLDTILNMKR